MNSSWKVVPVLTLSLVWDMWHLSLAQAAPQTNSDDSTRSAVSDKSAKPLNADMAKRLIAAPESLVVPELTPDQAVSQGDSPLDQAQILAQDNLVDRTAPDAVSPKLDVSLSRPFPIDDVLDETTPEVSDQLMPDPEQSDTPAPISDTLAPIIAASPAQNDVTLPTQPVLTAQVTEVPNQPEETPPALENATPSDFKLESLTTDFRNESDGNRTNRIIEPTAQLKLTNGDQLQVKTGWNTFQQSGIDTIQNFPLQGAWVKKLGANTLKLGGGVDVFNRLAFQPKLNAEIEVPIGVEVSPQGTLNRGLILTGLADYGAYKFNAKTLEQGINVAHFKPQLYWQIDPKTSLYSHYQLGLYNDGNVEHQTYSRFERKFGNFFVAANLFTWNYEADKELVNGYFSPRQFLTYNGEVGWAGDVTKGLRCRVTASLGQQTLNSNNSSTSQYNGRCTAAIAPNIELDFGYGFSNERKQTLNTNNYQNHSVTAQLRMKF